MSVTSTLLQPLLLLLPRTSEAVGRAMNMTDTLLQPLLLPSAAAAAAAAATDKRGCRSCHEHDGGAISAVQAQHYSKGSGTHAARLALAQQQLEQQQQCS
jgi:hypothetical protein